MPLPPPGFPRISAKWQSSSVDVAGIEENWDEVAATRRKYGREDRIILEDFLDRDALLKATTIGARHFVGSSSALRGLALLYISIP